MANLHFLNKVKCILNNNSDLTAHQFLHGLLSMNIFEFCPIALSIIEDLDAILNVNTMSTARVTSNQVVQWVF